MLPTISFPGFGTHEDFLYNEVKQAIITKLKGNYGFKRFIRDGYKTAVESKTKRYYDKGDIKDFENIECEWPLFYIFMIIDGVFKSLPDQIAEYQDLLKQRIYLDKHGGMFYPFKSFLTPLILISFIRSRDSDVLLRARGRY